MAGAGAPPWSAPYRGVIGYLRRLASSLAAYQVADIVSKFIAVLLLPVYTRYLTTSQYGIVELLANGVIFASIVIRFGIIEAFLRFYFADEDQDRRDALVRRSAHVPAADDDDSRRSCSPRRPRRCPGWCSAIVTRRPS